MKTIREHQAHAYCQDCPKEWTETPTAAAGWLLHAVRQHTIQAGHSVAVERKETLVYTPEGIEDERT